MLQKTSSVFVVYRRKTLTGSPDPTHANGMDKPCRPNLRAPSTTVVSRYCLYSGDDYVTGYRMSVEEMQGVYRRDIVRIRMKGGFMGIWQFHQAAEIAKNPNLQCVP